MVRKQIPKKKKVKTFLQRREDKTETQYEYLVEKHIIKLNHSHYKLLDRYSHLANNIYNQGLYRFRQALFQGKWLTYASLDKSFKQSYQQRDCMLYQSMKTFT